MQYCPELCSSEDKEDTRRVIAMSNQTRSLVMLFPYLCHLLFPVAENHCKYRYRYALIVNMGSVLFQENEVLFFFFTFFFFLKEIFV